ncbi:glycosyltransferase [Cryptosporangium sp. NPDC051539]|uniref:glycosyltransferase n=1 Tax=Cryptosporangium sp. NPDC051539 TaxID=3363962 RepID=UPI0037AD6DF1
MRILLATMGSTGDLQPFLALGRRLLDEGHDVRLTAQDGHAGRCAEVGVPFESAGIGEQASATLTELMPDVLAEHDPVKELSLVTAATARIQADALPALRGPVRDSDLVLHSPLAIGAAVAARAEGVPDVSVTHTWPLEPTRAYGPSNVDRGRILNGLAWWVARRVIGPATDPALNTVVTGGGLPRWKDVLFWGRRSALLELVPISPAVLRPDPHWAATTLLTGYWFLAEPEYTPSPELSAFLATARPLVIGFGSTAGYDVPVLARTVADAVRGLGYPVVIQGDFLAETGVDPGPDVFLAGHVPHDWLFARAAGVVHHGGAGTTAAAFRAGVPQAIISHQGDQPQWGRRLVQLGVGPEHCPHDRLDARWLSSTLRTLAEDAAMADRARALGSVVSAEDGTGEAVRALEKVHSGTGRGGR